jgi:PAS domain S-box-containing protein
MGINETDHAHESEIRRLKERIDTLEALNTSFQEMQRRYECLFDRSLECIYLHDLKGNFLDANQAALDLLGVGMEEITSLNLLSLLGEYQMPLADAMLEEIIREGSQKHATEFKLKRRKGDHIFIETQAAPLYKDGRAYAFMGVAKDVTERKTFEEALQASERNFRALPENANAGILVISGTQGLLRYANRAMGEILGYGISELMGKTLADIVSEEYFPKIFERYLSIIAGASVAPSYEAKFKQKNGFNVSVSITSAKTHWHGQPADMVIVHDISAEKLREVAFMKDQAMLEQCVAERTRDLMAINARLETEIEQRLKIEASLTESEEKYRSLVENINDMIFSVDDQGVFTYASPASQRLFGFTPDEIIGRSLFDFVLPQDGQALKKRLESQAQRISLIEEFRILDKHRGVRWVQTSSRPIQSGAQIRGYQGVITDITQKKLLEQRLIPAERLASAGQLAASIAHEINSPLQAITITLASLRKALANDQVLQENLDLLREAFISIRETVKNLLDLNRPGLEGKTLCSINTLIEKTLSLLNSQLKQTRVKVDLRLAPGLPPVMASAQQLGQVFLNLINNAIDAMAGEHLVRNEYLHQSSGGTITISTDLLGENIVTKFSDTGPGITAEAFEHLFDPFFTQGKKRGMGIGLFICRSIVEAHQGTISVKNAPGGGAVFMVNLPVASPQGDDHARI